MFFSRMKQVKNALLLKKTSVLGAYYGIFKLVHVLHQVNKYGVLALPSFKVLISHAEDKKCNSNPKNPWFNLTADVFATFLF